MPQWYAQLRSQRRLNLTHYTLENVPNRRRKRFVLPSFHLLFSPSIDILSVDISPLRTFITDELHSLAKIASTCMQFVGLTRGEGGHSVPVAHLHDDLASEPSSHHVITTILLHRDMIPSCRNLENVAQRRAGTGRTFGCRSPCP